MTERQPLLWYEITAKTPPDKVEAVCAVMQQTATGGLSVDEPVDILGPEQGFNLFGGQPLDHSLKQPPFLQLCLADHHTQRSVMGSVGRVGCADNTFSIGDFDVTDVASLDDGTFFVLERRFRWLEGVKMRIRRFSVGALKPDATADGETLIEADLESQIDNMEGLAVTRGTSGEILLTLISDDNFNHFLQRTLLLQFALPATKTAKTRPQL